MQARARAFASVCACVCVMCPRLDRQLAAALAEEQVVEAVRRLAHQHQHLRARRAATSPRRLRNARPI